MKTELPHLPPKERVALTAFIEKIQNELKSQLVSVILFGSYARGDAQPDSDIDVAVIMVNDDPGVSKAIRYLTVDIGLEHDRYLSTCIWSQAHWEKLSALQTRLYRNIQREGIDVLSALAE